MVLIPRHAALFSDLIKLDFNLRALAEAHNLSALELLDFTNDPEVRRASATLGDFTTFLAPLVRASERRTALDALCRTLNTATDPREVRLVAVAILNSTSSPREQAARQARLRARRRSQAPLRQSPAAHRPQASAPPLPVAAVPSLAATPPATGGQTAPPAPPDLPKPPPEAVARANPATPATLSAARCTHPPRAMRARVPAHARRGSTLRRAEARPHSTRRDTS